MTGFGFVMENAEKTLDEDYQNGLKLYKDANKYFEKAASLGNRYLIKKYPTFDDWLTKKKYNELKISRSNYWSGY